MAFEFKFPDVGEGIHEGEIVRWRVKQGDQVKEDQVLVEMETAKAIVEIPSPKTGTILSIYGKEGNVVNVGQVLVVIGGAGEIEGIGDDRRTEPAVSPSSPGVVGQIPTSAGVVLPARTAESAGAQSPSAPRVLPSLRQLAVSLGVDLNTVKATGAGGQITEKDVRLAADKNKISHWEKLGPIERIPLKGVRKTIAENMAASKTAIPHVTHADEADASLLIQQRAAKKTEAEKAGIKLTYMPFIIKCAVSALQKHPLLNSYLDNITNEIILKKFYNIAVAVDTDEGLMAPVIKNADFKNILQIAQELAELAEKCRTRKIELPNLQDGTFSVTNIGSVGGIYATPIIAPGQTAILGVYRIKEKPVAADGQVSIKPMLNLTVTYDHRVVDGAEGARFMNDLIASIEGKQ